MWYSECVLFYEALLDTIVAQTFLGRHVAVPSEVRSFFVLDQDRYNILGRVKREAIAQSSTAVPQT